MTACDRTKDEILTLMNEVGRWLSGFWRILAFVVCCVAPVLPAAALAQSFQSLHSIRKAAVEFALTRARDAMPSARLSVHAARLDSRLRLAQCAKPLQLSSSSGSRRGANVLVSVQCAAPTAWKLYVPVTIKARLRVLVAGESLSRGTHVRPGMLGRAERDVSNLAYGYFVHQRKVVGQVLRRNIAPGTVLTPQMLRPPLLVRQGQLVTLSVAAAGFSVTTQGVALQSGARGALVQVRNTRSNRVVQGVVTGSGQVRVEG